MSEYHARHFAISEWKCRCSRPDCDAPTRPDPALVALLDDLRDEVGPLTIASGLRCRYWNEHEGGEPNSGHLYGTEADVECRTSRHRFKLLSAIFRRNIRRVGLGKTFIHVGLSTTPLAQDVAWNYHP